MLHSHRTGRVLQLPVDFVSQSDIQDFCSANNVAFFSLGSPENWEDPAVFRVCTHTVPSQGHTVPYLYVKNWRDAYDAIGERVLKGGRYRHFKGSEYTTLGPAIIEIDGTPAVLYQGADGTVWVRPEDKFFGVANLGNGRFVPRFAYLGPAQPATEDPRT